MQQYDHMNSIQAVHTRRQHINICIYIRYTKCRQNICNTQVVCTQNVGSRIFLQNAANSVQVGGGSEMLQVACKARDVTGGWGDNTHNTQYTPVMVEQCLKKKHDLRYLRFKTNYSQGFIFPLDHIRSLHPMMSMGHWRTPDPGTSQVSLINPASRNWRRPCSGKLSSSSHNFLDDPGSQPQNVAFPGAKPLQRKPLGLRWQRCARRCTRPPWKSRFGWVFWSLQMRPPRSFVLGIGVRIHV